MMPTVNEFGDVESVVFPVLADDTNQNNSEIEAREDSDRDINSNEFRQ